MKQPVLLQQILSGIDYDMSNSGSRVLAKLERVHVFLLLQYSITADNPYYRVWHVSRAAMCFKHVSGGAASYVGISNKNLIRRCGIHNLQSQYLV